MVPPISRPRALVELDPTNTPPTALADRAYATLKHRILTCKFRPGQRLIEKELCADMGISRTPLREALNRLGLEGLVSLVPYHGFEVAPITLRDIRDMCELRYIVESETASRAAQRATPEDIDRLVELAELRYTPGDRETYEDYLLANSAFHLQLARCSHNARLEGTVISLLDQLQRPLYLGLDLGLNAQDATAEHLAVIDAVQRHDGERAASLMRDQITEAEQRMLSGFSSWGLDADGNETKVTPQQQAMK